MTNPVFDLLNRGTADVIVREDLEKKLRSGEKLRVKFGIDPTGSVLHLGHAVILRKLKQFQDLGHQVILLIGDFTACIGDPTGRVSERKLMTDEEIHSNMKDYVRQASLVLDIDRVEVRYNSEWLGRLDLKEIIFLTSKVTYAQVAQRADFKKRIQNDLDLSLQEFLYPIMQGYDSVALEADVELGGTDQKFNLLMGRQLQERYSQIPQSIITCPILEGLDGVEKMSKSLNNFISLTDSPSDMFGKLMSIPDALILRYFELATDVSLEAIAELKGALESGKNPRDVKMLLGRTLVTLYHNDQAADDAERQFIQIFSQNQLPDTIPEHVLKGVSEIGLIDLIADCGLASSKSDARRLIEGGGVKLDGEKIMNVEHGLTLSPEGILVQVGKRRFLTVKSS